MTDDKIIKVDFKKNKKPPTEEELSRRQLLDIRERLEKINELMKELRRMSEETPDIDK